MLETYRVAMQLVAFQVVLSAVQLVSYANHHDFTLQFCAYVCLNHENKMKTQNLERCTYEMSYKITFHLEHMVLKCGFLQQGIKIDIDYLKMY
jgi:hypothetical protein